MGRNHLKEYTNKWAGDRRTFPTLNKQSPKPGRSHCTVPYPSDTPLIHFFTQYRFNIVPSTASVLVPFNESPAMSSQHTMQWSRKHTMLPRHVITAPATASTLHS